MDEEESREAEGEQLEVSEVRAAIKRLTRLLGEADHEFSEAASLARITELEELKSAITAGQAAEAVAFRQMRVAREAAAGVPADRRGVRVGDEIGFAKKTSPGSGRAFLTFARTLDAEMPRTRQALATGELSEQKARMLVDETATLTPDQRAAVEEAVAPDMEELGVRSLRRLTRATVDHLSGDDSAAQAEKAWSERRVSIRPLGHGVARLSAILPAPQAIAAFEALRADAGTTVAAGDPDERTRTQVMADLFVARLTGEESAGDVRTCVDLVIGAESLLSDGTIPAWLPGVGPLPAKTARSFIAANEAEVFIRRLFTSPETGQLVSMESKSRVFTGGLRRMVVFRDDVCRTPWCDAPIKHVDHIIPAVDGGPTEWSNASGLCESCNYAKEHNGWSHESTDSGLTVRTPSGAEYTVHDRPLLRGDLSRGDLSRGELTPDLGPPTDSGLDTNNSPPGDGDPLEAEILDLGDDVRFDQSIIGHPHRPAPTTDPDDSDCEALFARMVMAGCG